MALTEPARETFAGHGLAIHRDGRLSFGYTEDGFPAAALKALFPGRKLLFLRQVHSARIVSEDEWRPGIEADGILLERPGAVAVIQTADCLPLFFYRPDRGPGGVLHVGWRGLQQGIEEALARRLGGDLKGCDFLLGPAIEGACYEVGEELLDLFSKKAYNKDIFTFSRPGKYRLDLRRGVTLALTALGAAADRILDCGLCTFCTGGRFPSFRRDGAGGGRIYNFLLLGERPPADR